MLAQLPRDVRTLRTVVIGLAAITVATTVVLITTGEPRIGWAVSAEAFAFAVAAMIYRAESRPHQKHRPK